MNKQQLLTAGSVLLATTALSGVANAGYIAELPSATNLVGGKAFGTMTAVVPVKIANTIFSTTAATANGVTIGPKSFAVAFSNNFNGSVKFSVEIDPVGATIANNTADVHLLLTNAGSFLGPAFYTVSATGNCTSITALTTKLILDGCGGVNNAIAATNGANTNTSASYAGVIFSGVTFNNGAALASVGSTISLNGLVYNANNNTQNFETITSATIITSAAPISASITSGGTATANSSATPVAFAYFTPGGAVGAASILSVTLASVTITGTGALAADLTSVVVPEAAVAANSPFASIQVTVTSGLLSQAGVVGLSTSGTGTAVTNYTVANFSAGVATFSLNAGTGLTSFSIDVAFSGTAAISAASAGTITVAFGRGHNTTGQAAPAITGKTASISLGGFSAELNTFLGSSNASFSSFARIHNNGILASPAIVTVRNDATGATLGTYTTAAIATSQTLQISAKDIETGAGITAAAGLNYTLQIAGSFSGYAQHIIFNPATGQLADLSSFRNKGGAGVTTP